ncbi:hypothetical protein [Microbispora bryophytorum]|uniref:Uncharacterized protein n=1 Tax=Microbispora bryophytorum subsp. camponoti TaxID=1677852 RepID=A0ABR8L865_9ACTN|nr:hypothetical protein [Microbispora camponoti]MBD3145650.1 hypothetical protein [Microbispora camponoti]
MRDGLALAAVAIATAALAALPSAPHAVAAAAARATVTGAAGNGDRNGNSTTVRLGNGVRNVSQLTVGSARSGTGIQQKTIGVGGLANAQSIMCRRWSRLCDLTQRVRASDRQSDMVRLPEARPRRHSGSSSGGRTSTAGPRPEPNGDRSAGRS